MIFWVALAFKSLGPEIAARVWPCFLKTFFFFIIGYTSTKNDCSMISKFVNDVNIFLYAIL